MRKKGSRRRRIRDGHEAASRRGAGARSRIPAACAGFAPLASTAATVLILGTLPGRTSLARGEYYAQPRNAFWPIMGDLFGAGPDLPYAERTSRLIERRIAVWDVCASAKRAGSLDSKIAIGSILPNDFNGFFASHPHIEFIGLNGAMAESLYHRFVSPRLGANAREIAKIRLPSTSPANASAAYAAKLTAWSAIRRPAAAAIAPILVMRDDTAFISSSGKKCR